jgi:hypothetical protein
MTKVEKAIEELKIIHQGIAKLTVELPEPVTEIAQEAMSAIYEAEALSADAIGMLKGLVGDIDGNSR